MLSYQQICHVIVTKETRATLFIVICYNQAYNCVRKISHFYKSTWPQLFIFDYSQVNSSAVGDDSRSSD